jgi:hypothetical protein
MLVNAIVFPESCSHFAIAVKAVMNVLQLSECINYFLPHALGAPTPRVLSPTAHRKLKVFWLVLRLQVHADSSQLLALPGTKSDKSMP